MKNKRSKPGSEEEMDSELRFHLEHLVEEKIRSGLSAEEARRQALVEFGGAAQFKEEIRDVYRLASLETMKRNLQSGLRLIRRAPSFSLAVIFTLTLGIGANSTVFSAINAVLLRPLPYPRADELVSLKQVNPKAKSPESMVAPQRVEDWNRLSKAMRAISGWYIQDVSELSGVVPEKVTQALVTPRFLQVWGVSPAVGRDFTFREERFGGPNAALISDRFWRRRFQGDPGAVGRQLRLDKASYAIVGVLPAGFQFPAKEADVWTPGPPDAPIAQSRESTWYQVIGRMKAGVTIPQARSDLAGVQAALGRQFPKTDAALSVKVESLKETTVHGIRGSLWLLFGSVTLLLVIACMNVAALLVARTADRTREISVRLSLGASRSAVVVQLLTECFVLALPGALLGLLFAGAGTRVLRTLAGSLPRAEEIVLDWRIALYTLACSVVATLLCGLVPALRATRKGLAGGLASSGRTQVSSRSPWQWTLVGVQVSLAVTLLVGAGLLVRSFQELGRVSPGFEIPHILTLRISGNWGETADFKKLTARVERTLDELRNLPGVQAAATTLMIPGVDAGFPNEFRVTQKDQGQIKASANSRYVSDGYFTTMHIPLLAGEPCRRGMAGVVINKSFADAYLNGNRGVGETIASGTGPGERKGMVRGIVGDAREQGLNQAPAPTAYWCSAAANPSPYFLVRTAGEPLTMVNALRRKIQQLEPARSVFDVSPLADHLTENMAENRLRTVLLSMFALTAVALVCVGLYGTLSYLVNVRRREIGLRLAIGASRPQIAGQFVSKGVGVCLVGCAVGLSAAALGTRSLAGMLYGVSTLDLPTFASVAALIVAAGALSSLVPSVRAARLDPMQVLRDE